MPGRWPRSERPDLAVIDILWCRAGTIFDLVVEASRSNGSPIALENQRVRWTNWWVLTLDISSSHAEMRRKIDQSGDGWPASGLVEKSRHMLKWNDGPAVVRMRKDQIALAMRRLSRTC